LEEQGGDPIEPVGRREGYILRGGAFEFEHTRGLGNPRVEKRRGKNRTRDEGGSQENF